ncbi:MAG TPA: septal ring lytic transglycosylase RlpA family protein [Gammaproteobacteria bacterium]|nr:septal ring lytic transglycosylase RlpA family protein [Gammaproteobacteria bacterium]
MSLTELVPSRLACGVLLSSAFLAGWAPDAQPARTRTPAAKTQRADAKDGKPPSYDVLGKRYRVLASSAGYRERGIASWYGHPFDGRPTSSGETYDMHEMTAAHRSLPIPTWVEVTNLANGKRVTVKVNDRGPFVGKRLIDLSFAAATKLDIVRNGTAQVEVRALPGPPARTAEGRERAAQPDPPASKPESTAQAARPAPPVKASEPTKPPEPPKPVQLDARTESERLFAEAGRFRTRDDAVRVVDDLKAQGFVNAFVVTEDGRRKSMHRVRVGPLRDGAEVDTMNDRLRELGARRSHSVEMR